MLVTQIYSIMNAVTQEILGETNVINEDLSNIVDVGTAVFSATSVDNYVKSLVDHIGKVVFVNRPYVGNAPSVLMDGWEFGSVLEKIQVEMPDATENESWNLVNGQEYNPNIFYQPTVSAKFFSKRVTFEVNISFTERQVKSSFSSREQLNGFLSMIFNAVDKSMNVKIDSLIMRTINNMTALTVADEYASPTDYTTKSGVRAVNLLYLYNDTFGTTLTVDKCLTDPEFIKFATLQIGLYKDRISKLSTLFNTGGKERFTPEAMLKIIMLSNFRNSATVYLQSNTFNKELVSLPDAETVPYWQGSGTDYSFGSVSSINVTQGTKTVNLDGILAVMFDRDALGVSNLDRRVTSDYNAKGEFFTNFYKFDSGYFNDLNENFVVFFVK